MRFKAQATRDAGRDIYSVTFPTELSSDHVLAWLRSIGGTLPRRTGGFFARDSLVFETWATSAGFTHRLMTPKGSAEYITSQLRAHARGITVSKDADRPSINWTAGVEVGMSNPLRQLRIAKHSDLSASLLAALAPLQDDEMMMIQWVVAPAPFERPPTSNEYVYSGEFSVRRSLLGKLEASKDEVQDRRQKLTEQNLLGVGRVMVKAGSIKRSEELLRRVESSLSSANSDANYFKSRGRGVKLIQEANDAATPSLFPAQFTLSELAGVISWPIGQPFIPGLARGASRQLFATADVASEGRVLGKSTYSGHERLIALPYKFATRHMVVTGGSGTGKTAFLVNCFAQDVERGYGAVVMDAGDSQSDETMFSGALKSIPPERVKDVLVIDVANESSHPVGFNIFEQTDPRTVADQMVHLFQNLYSDISGVWLPQLLYHGVYTLAEHGGLSFVDLGTLLNPTTPDEKEWAEYVINGVKDPNIRDWWDRWRALGMDQQQTRMEPLYNRIWQVTSRPEIINIIGQSKSTFNISDVLAENKILLINLAGLSADTAKIIGTLFMNAIWTAARRFQAPQPNYLYLDEFQVMTASLSVKLDDLLSRARKHNLGLAMATQYFERGIPLEVRSAAINNARTKVIFRVGSEEARIWSAEFDKLVENQDFRNLNDYEALVRIASESGVADVTLATLKPRTSLGTERAVRQHSRVTYGRALSDVVSERQQRRVAPPNRPQPSRPPIGEQTLD